MAKDARRVSTPLIINLAPTGITATRAMSTAVPLQPDEIVRDVLASADLGITMVHLHARDENGLPTYRKEVYGRIIGGIRERRPDLILCVSCSGRTGLSFEQRAEVLDLPDDLRPDMASLTLSSLNFSTSASVNAPDVVVGLASRMKDRGIRPELEVFDFGMANMILSLTQRGLIEQPYYVNLLFGNIASAQARFLDVGAMVAALPAGAIYSLAGFGSAQLPMAAMAAAAAPGVRIGLEDSLWFDSERQQLASNAALVERVHRLAELVGRTVMTGAQLRRILGFMPHGREEGAKE